MKPYFFISSSLIFAVRSVGDIWINKFIRNHIGISIKNVSCCISFENIAFYIIDHFATPISKIFPQWFVWKIYYEKASSRPWCLEVGYMYTYPTSGHAADICPTYIGHISLFGCSALVFMQNKKKTKISEARLLNAVVYDPKGPYLCVDLLDKFIQNIFFFLDDFYINFAKLKKHHRNFEV